MKNFLDVTWIGHMLVNNTASSQASGLHKQVAWLDFAFELPSIHSEPYSPL